MSRDITQAGADRPAPIEHRPYTPPVGWGGGRPSPATVLFTDLAGSTEIRASSGRPRRRAARRHDDAIHAAAAEHLGEAVNARATAN